MMQQMDRANQFEGLEYAKNNVSSHLCCEQHCKCTTGFCEWLRAKHKHAGRIDDLEAIRKLSAAHPRPRPRSMQEYRQHDSDLNYAHEGQVAAPDGNDRVLTDKVRPAMQIPQAVVSKAVPKRVPQRSALPAQRSVKRLKKHDGTSQVAIPEVSQIGVKAVIASEPALLRRSGRSRSKVCAFWHGEIPEYEKQTDGLKVLVGVIGVPTWHN
jgi:hypothetical protein